MTLVVFFIADNYVRCNFMCVHVQNFMKYEKMARARESVVVKPKQPTPQPKAEVPSTSETNVTCTSPRSKAEVTPSSDTSGNSTADSTPPECSQVASNTQSMVSDEPIPEAAADVTISSSSSTTMPSTDSSEIYNGAKTDLFSWSQTVTDVDIKVPLPKGTKASQLCVDIKTNHLSVTVQKDGSDVVLLDGDLFDRVRVPECMWSKDGDQLQICLEKYKDCMWKSAFIDGPEIDLNKTDNTRQLTDYDDETQTVVRKAMYDNDQKRKGLPTSNEQKTLSVLEKAWNSEGSPFKGTEYDPSVLNLSGSSDGSGLPPGAM
eukprot:scpid66447/ scgid0552/ NudC domain-containing protein 3